MSEVLSRRLSSYGSEDQQSLRLGRFLMAAGTSLLVSLALCLFAFLGLIPWRAALEGTAGIVTLIVGFYILFRTGLNLRFSDPSLTTEQATMLQLAYLRDPGMDVRRALTEFLVLLIVLPWFAVMGGYVNRLRVRLSDSHKELRKAFDRLGELAIRDELTGVYNRRFLMETLAPERSRAERLGEPFSVFLDDN